MLQTNAGKREKRKTGRRRGFFGSLTMWIILAFFLFYTLAPMIWLVISSLKTNGELMGNPFSLPETPQFGNYLNAFRVSGLTGLFLNTVIVSLGATFLNVLIAAMAAYVIARFNFRFKELIFIIIVAGIMVPISALMVPIFTLVQKLGLYNTRMALILTYSGVSLSLSLFIIRGFMNNIPVELEEAAIIDGCGFYSRFFRIILPLARPGIITAATFQFLYCWNEFIYAMLLTSSNSVRTMQVGIRFFSNQFTTDYTSMYAAIVISIIPSMIGYVLFQEQIISGLTSGAVKG